jgi:hypothetical protein
VKWSQPGGSTVAGKVKINTPHNAIIYSAGSVVKPTSIPFSQEKENANGESKSNDAQGSEISHLTVMKVILCFIWQLLLAGK